MLVTCKNILAVIWTNINVFTLKSLPCTCHTDIKAFTCPIISSKYMLTFVQSNVRSTCQNDHINGFIIQYSRQQVLHSRIVGRVSFEAGGPADVTSGRLTCPVPSREIIIF